MMSSAFRLAEIASSYEAAVSPGTWLGEPPPEPLNESELSWIWAGQRYPDGALSMVDGRELRVINPGRPGGAAGPDFLDAVLEIGGAPVRGDVELHVRSSGFRAHGHDADPAYDGVALHVVFRADEGAATGLNSGAQAPIAAFAPWFDNRRDELQRWLTADALWREPCRDAVWRLGEDACRTVLRDAGLHRLQAKADALGASAADVGEVEALWRALLDVLGVGGDREGFRRLARAFPASLARHLVSVADGREAVGRLSQALAYAAGLDVPPLPTACELPPRLRPPIAASGRPANRPQRRLAGLAALFARAEADLPRFTRRSILDADNPRALIACWQVTQRGAALIGPDRAREIVTNLVLPFGAADPSLREPAMALASQLGPAPAYGRTAFLESNLRPSSGRRLVRGALEQQGLLAFLADWCSQGGCGRCPLS